MKSYFIKRAHNKKTFFFNMNANDFLIEIDKLSKLQNDIKLYPYTDKEKLYGRFLKKVIFPNVIELVTTGWLGDLYKWTNGVDLANYYIVPFNNHFNKKELSFEKFKLDWYQTKNNPNQIIDFEAFMTDDKMLVGYLGELRDSQNNNFIGIAQGGKIKTDVLIIATSIYKFYDFIVEQLQSNGRLELPQDEAYWRALDPELDSYYSSGKILEYKLRYLLDSDSSKYKKYEEELEKIKHAE